MNNTKIVSNNIINNIEKSMKILEFIELANAEARSVIPLAKEYLKLLNSKNKIGELLNECGYQYDSKVKQWIKIEEKGIAISDTFEDFVELNNLTDKFKFRGLEAPKKKVRLDPVKNAEQFTIDEMNILREIIRVYKGKSKEGLIEGSINHSKEEQPTEDKLQSIESAINELGRNPKNVRKTFLIDAKIAEDFQSFCDERSLKYSDVISVAIKKLIDNYENKS